VTRGKLYIRDVGEGRPIVFIHGWSCPGMFFDQQVAAFSGQARCIVPDMPGHGLSVCFEPLTIKAAAGALHAYLAAHDLQDAVLCGWSMGALVAYALVRDYGADRISSVVALDMTPKVLNDAGWKNGTLSGLTEDQNEHFITTIAADWPRLPRRIARRLFAAGQEPRPDLLEMARAEIAAADPAKLRQMWMSLTALDFRDLLCRFPVPLHLVAGARSQLYGPGLHAWHQQNVPEFQLTVFDNSGHAPHLEEPGKFNSLMLDELRR